MHPASSNLSKLDKFMNRYPQNNQPAAFEHLVSVVFSRIFFLPFQTANTRNDRVIQRVLWTGQHSGNVIAKSPGGSDAVVFAHGFHVLVEATLRTGKNQWKKEFSECVNHYDDFVSRNTLDRKRVYAAIVTPEIHRDTHLCFRAIADDNYNFVLLSATQLWKIADTVQSLVSVRHLDICDLFHKISATLRNSHNLAGFESQAGTVIATWQSDTIKQERTVFFGLRCYEAMKDTGRTVVGTSDIIVRLERDERFNRYLSLAGGELPKVIRESLITERLARLIPTPDEDFFCRVKSGDFKARCVRLVQEVQRRD